MQHYKNFKQSADLWHVREPPEDGEDTLKVIWHSGVSDSIVVHDLDSSQLVVGSVDLSAQNLYKSKELDEHGDGVL